MKKIELTTSAIDVELVSEHFLFTDTVDTIDHQWHLL